jgi:hypothetical protein
MPYKLSRSATTAIGKLECVILWVRTTEGDSTLQDEYHKTTAESTVKDHSWRIYTMFDRLIAGLQTLRPALHIKNQNLLKHIMLMNEPWLYCCLIELDLATNRNAQQSRNSELLSRRCMILNTRRSCYRSSESNIYKRFQIPFKHGQVSAKSDA